MMEIEVGMSGFTWGSKASLTRGRDDCLDDGRADRGISLAGGCGEEL